jgi:adenosylcobinamide kinase/adenosylcobinamide-phosphate guanylyltransferase
MDHHVAATSFLPRLTLTLGGAASGKSRFAENLIVASGLRPVYVATADARDGEMAAKISRHRERRGTIWRTLEAPFDLSGALAGPTPDEAVLVDCLTMWLTNHLLAGHDPAIECDRLVAALAACPAPVVAVTNEVGQGIVPENALSRRFREAQGALNQRVASEAGLVVAVMAGLPLALKGRLPE